MVLRSLTGVPRRVGMVPRYPEKTGWGKERGKGCGDNELSLADLKLGVLKS